MEKQMLAELARIVSGHASPGLQVSTAIPRLTIWSSSAPTSPTLAMYHAKFYLLLQGSKRLKFGSRTLEFVEGTYSVSSVGLPFTAQVIRASRAAPYMGVELRLDPLLVASVLFEMPPLGEPSAPALVVSEARADILEPLGRLLRLLDHPADIPVLAAQYERELCYRLLQGPMRDTLRQVVQKNTRVHQIRMAIDWICANACKPMNVKELATSIGMSATSFHRHFRSVTGHSPLAYQRLIRLIEARRLLGSGTTNVTTTAYATGYASCSQFSREYKRMFSVSPRNDVFVR